MVDFNRISGLNFDTRLKDPLIEQAEQLEVRELAKDGLRKINKNKNEVKTLMESYEIASKKVDRGRDLYESYDDISFETKLRVDMIYYDQLLQKLDECEGIEDQISGIYRTVKEIYEHINIKPEIYGRDITYQFLNESIADQKKTLSNIIYEYINTHFYKLDPEKRKEKYVTESAHFAKELIQEGIDPQVAIQRGVKSVVMEGFLSRVAFPQTIQYRIKYLMEDESYGEVFDQSSLIELWSKFKTQVSDMAKTVSTVI